MIFTNLFWKKNLIFLAGLFGLLIFYSFLYKIYMPRVNAFGCFDDCFNFMGGYFLLHNKHLYSEIFYNHAPGMAYISALIQFSTHPQNLYDIVLKHRQFTFFFGLAMNIVLFTRFGYRMLPIILIYELTKFYVFGDRFLAEGVIVYPLMYLTGLGLKKLQDKSFFLSEWILIGIFVWFVIFMREPFVPLTLFYLGVLVWGKKEWKKKWITLGIFSLLSLITLFYHNISEFYFNVITTNTQVSLHSAKGSDSIFGGGIVKAFFYPVFIFFVGEPTYLRIVEIGISILFFFSTASMLWQKQWKVLLFVFALLGLANFRFAPPGMQYYEAFHQIVWYGLFLFVTAQVVIFLPKVWMRVLVGGGFCILVGYIMLSTQSFWREKANPYQEFIINYGGVLQAGQIVQTLSKPTDTVFVDGFDDMVYWVSQRYSNYPYSWYTSLMPGFSKYTNARTSMLQTNPPDFYYGSCLDDNTINRTLTKMQAELYVRLLDNGKPSCLLVKKSKLQSISQQQWAEAKKGYYTLPESTP